MTRSLCAVSRRLNKRGAAGGAGGWEPTTPADRWGEGGFRGRPDLTARCQRGFY